MDLKSIHNVYFIGIGGIGMSAIARYFCAGASNFAFSLNLGRQPSQIDSSISRPAKPRFGYPAQWRRT